MIATLQWLFSIAKTPRVGRESFCWNLALMQTILTHQMT
jgi:hypothetical protein